MSNADKASWIMACMWIYIFASCLLFIADIGRWDLNPERKSSIFGAFVIVAMFIIYWI